MSLSRFIFLSSKAYVNKCASPTYVKTMKPITSTFSPRMDFIFGKKTLAEELGIPAPPKKPKTPFSAYFSGEYKNLTHIEKPSERVKFASQNWNSLDDSEKSRYFEEYKVDFEEYQKKKEEYKKNLTPDQIYSIRNLREKKKAKSEASLLKQKLKKEAEALGKPKHPGNPVTIFIKDLEEKGNPLMSLQSYRTEWNNLTDSSKETYREKAKELMKKYQTDLYTWELKMMAIDRKDVVRISTITALKKAKKIDKT